MQGQECRGNPCRPRVRRSAAGRHGLPLPCTKPREQRLAERTLGTLRDNGTEIQHTPCDKTVIALMHAWNMQDVLRGGQDGVAFA